MRVSQKNENGPWEKNRQSQASSRSQTIDCLRFSKSLRILTKRHYQLVIRANHKLMGTYVFIHYRQGKALVPKLGITVSKRYGKAHLRNRFKRVVRDAFREYIREFPTDLEMNVNPRSSHPKITKEKILDDFRQFANHFSPRKS